MSRQLVPPQFPLAPAEYERQYFDEMVQLQSPGELRGTKITLTDLPTSPTDLESGALYNDSGTVKIVS